MARLLDLRDSRPSGLRHWAFVLCAILAAAGAGILIVRGVSPSPVAAPAAEQRVPLQSRRAEVAKAIEPAVAQGAVHEATGAVPAPVACPFQTLTVAVDDAKASGVCFDATRIQQTGNVRSFSVRGSGADAWQLQVDAAGAMVLKARLTASDGREYGCDSQQCGGIHPERADARGTRGLTFDSARLARLAKQPAVEGATEAQSKSMVVLNGRLSVPSDDLLPGLACEGPSVALQSPNGSSRKFCGQGGAGFEIADDGMRNYRFQDFDGETLMVAVNEQLQVTAVEFGPYGCRGTACGGVSVSGGGGPDEVAGRTFLFGRTALYQGRDAQSKSTAAGERRPDLVLDGSISMPAQE